MAMSFENKIWNWMPLVAIVSLFGLLALGGLTGGYSLVVDPSGESLGFPAEQMDSIPFLTNFLIPGLFILLFFGVAPLIVIYGLVGFNQHKSRVGSISDYHWSWRAARTLSLALIIWIAVQIIIIGLLHPIQGICGLGGLILYLLLSMNGIKQIYRHRKK